VVTVTALGGGTIGSTIYLKVEQYSADLINVPDLECPGGQTCSLSVSVVPAYRYVDPVVVGGTVTVIACSDVFCSSGPVTNGRQKLDVEYTVTQGFTVTPHLPQRLNFVGTAGNPPPSQTIVLTHPRGELPTWTEQPSAFSPWLTITPTGSPTPTTSPSLVTVSVSDVAPGTYQTSIDFRYGNSPRSITVEVSYTVN
jgi:hypothetical protein